MLLPLVLLAFLSPAPAQALTADAVSTQIARDGASKVLASLYSDRAHWTALLRGIASGTSAWLTVAVKLRPDSDAGASEQLELAVGEALEHQADTVLRLAIPSFTLEAVCGAPDIDDPRYDGADRAMRAVHLRQRKVKAIQERELVALRDRCITALEKSKADIAKFYGVAP